jgi:hypothetical protein
MNPLRLAFFLILTLTAMTLAGPGEEAISSAQTFYDGYLKILNGKGDSKKWISKSDKVAPSFKKAYVAYMKEPDSDPVICGQDFPKSGYKASLGSANEDTATVIISSRDPAMAYSFKTVFIRKEGKWLLAGTDDLKAKK